MYTVYWLKYTPNFSSVKFFSKISPLELNERKVELKNVIKT